MVKLFCMAPNAKKKNSMLFLHDWHSETWGICQAHGDHVEDLDDAAELSVRVFNHSSLSSLHTSSSVNNFLSELKLASENRVSPWEV